jgi:hypothetical protein
MSDVFEVSYVFHNDVGRLQTVTVEIIRIHSADIVSIGIEIYISYFLNKKNRQFRYDAFASFASNASAVTC